MINREAQKFLLEHSFPGKPEVYSNRILDIFDRARKIDKGSKISYTDSCGDWKIQTEDVRIHFNPNDPYYREIRAVCNIDGYGYQHIHNRATSRETESFLNQVELCLCLLESVGNYIRLLRWQSLRSFLILKDPVKIKKKITEFKNITVQRRVQNEN